MKLILFILSSYVCLGLICSLTVLNNRPVTIKAEILVARQVKEFPVEASANLVNNENFTKEVFPNILDTMPIINGVMSELIAAAEPEMPK